MIDRRDPMEQQGYQPWPDVCRALLMAGVPVSIFVAFGLWLASHVPWFADRFETAYYKIAYLLMLMDSPQLLSAGDGYATVFFIWLWVVPVGVATMALNEGIQRWRRYRTGRHLPHP